MRALARRYRTAIVGDEVLTELTIDGPAPTSFAGDEPNPGTSSRSGPRPRASGVACASAGSAPTPTSSPAWPPPARTPTSAPPCSSSWSWPSCSRTPTSCWTDGAPSCGAGATCSSGLLRGPAAVVAVRRCRRAGLSLWVDLGAPVSSALAAISRPARRARGARDRRSGSTAASSGTCGCRSARRPRTCVVPSPGWRRRWARPGGHRARRRTRPGPRAGVTEVRSAAASASASPGRPSCSRPHRVDALGRRASASARRATARRRTAW